MVLHQQDPLPVQFPEQSLNLVILKLGDLLLALVHQARERGEGDVPGREVKAHGVSG